MSKKLFSHKELIDACHNSKRAAFREAAAVVEGFCRGCAIGKELASRLRAMSAAETELWEEPN